MTNLEGLVLRRRRLLDPAGEARSELDVLADLAELLDGPVPLERDPALVFDELARASAGGRADYSGLSHARLDREQPEHWPVAPDSTPRLFGERFAHPDGLARLVPVAAGGPADDLRADAPVYLVTGRVLAHYQSGAQTRRVPQLTRTAPGPFVELHPRLALRLGVEEGDDVRVTSNRGEAVAPARITRSIRPDTVFMPFHWAGEALVNAVTNDATDPVSGMPEFKVCAVSVERAEASTGSTDERRSA
jgi:assimilatory nitrate reductase catalytic subunit